MQLLNLCVEASHSQQLIVHDCGLVSTACVHLHISACLNVCVCLMWIHVHLCRHVIMYVVVTNNSA